METKHQKNVGKGDAAMEETSLRITGANKSFLNKITNTISKMLIPTKVGINGMLITVKRNSMIKAFERFNIEEENKELFEKKYDETYEAYLESLDKYVMDSIYKKVKNNTATDFEKNALSRYYSVISLKEYLNLSGGSVSIVLFSNTNLGFISVSCSNFSFPTISSITSRISGIFG